MSPKTRTSTLKDLQTQCEVNDLDPVGTVDELRERLANWERTKLVTGPPLPTPESFLDEALGMDTRGSCDLEEVGGETVEWAGNVFAEEDQDCEAGSSTALLASHGMTGRMKILNQAIDSRMSRLALLEESIISLEKRRALNRKNMESLQDCVEGLIPFVEPYLAMRNTFISMFKRDKLDEATEEDLKIIEKGTLSTEGL